MKPGQMKHKLEHWAEHNSSHADGFRKQAHEAGKMGFQDIETELLLAADAMDKAGSHLRRAIEKLGDPQD
ncbi:MAG: hypothetical protein C5S43_04485 [Candidatus Methanocomedens sp.]|nr:MAG: hypothetical protein C5S43_04485 [ANME-2 cluster archaeon]